MFEIKVIFHFKQLPSNVILWHYLFNEKSLQNFSTFFNIDMILAKKLTQCENKITKYFQWVKHDYYWLAQDILETSYVNFKVKFSFFVPINELTNVFISMGFFRSEISESNLPKQIFIWRLSIQIVFQNIQNSRIPECM